MADHDEYFAANRANWNDRAAVHARSSMYDLNAYESDPSHLSDVVSFDVPRLGDLTGLEAVHLQCHIGTDTLSLARLGATVTGVDQSDASLAVARQLFEACSTDGRFIEANVYDAQAALGQRFDLVFTGVGALNWLPDIERWAAVVAGLLEPGGRLFLREGHPMLWSLADTSDGSLQVAYPYFELSDPMIWDEGITYTGDDDRIDNARCYEWNHGLSEIITALLKQGLTLELFEEHDSCDWEALPHMIKENGRYWLPEEQRALVPLMYTLVMRRQR